jgi:hypothetical protein
MSVNTKLIEELKIADLELNPVWEFANDDSTGETRVFSVTAIPVSNLSGRIVGTKVQLANRQDVWALIGNVSAQKPHKTSHFLTLTVWRDNKRFHLARYFDFDYQERGPAALADFLGLRVDDVFPIAYDMREFVRGDPSSLAGEISEEPKKRLTRDERMKLIFEDMN